MKKKMIALLLASSMLAGILTACGSSSSGSASSSGEAQPAAETAAAVEENTDPLGKYDEPVHLTTFFEIAPVMMDSFQESKVEELYYTQHMHDKLNIYIDYLWYSPDTADDAQQKVSMAIASGEIPDFMSVSKAQLATLAKTDLINKNLEELFEKYASPRLKEQMFAEGTEAYESLRYDGNIIALPDQGGQSDLGSILWIRKDWLDNLGLEVPKTTDDLYAVMDAFTHNDPDGNGVDDTIGLTLQKDYIPTVSMGDAVGLFNSFGAYPGNWSAKEDGTLEYGSVTDGAKDAIAFLAKAYSEGLLETDFASRDGNKAAEASVGGRSGIQFGRMWNSIYPLQNNIDQDPNADWIAAPIPQGTPGQNPFVQCDTAISNLFVVSAKCEHPEAVIKLLNYYVDEYNDPEEYVKCVEDPALEGTNTDDFPQHYAMLKTFDPLKNVKARHEIMKSLETGDTSNLNAEEQVFYKGVTGYLDGNRSDFGYYRVYGPEDSAYAVIDTYVENDQYLVDKFTGPDTKTMGQKMSLINDKILEFYTKVIMGIEPVDKFDAFRDELNSVGLADITAEVNEWYQTK